MADEFGQGGQKMKRITSKMVTCPYCGARPGRSCKGERIPSANSFGGGWGGPPPRKNSHHERIALAKERQAANEGGER
jgi:hypothetical protein